MILSQDALEPDKGVELKISSMKIRADRKKQRERCGEGKSWAYHAKEVATQLSAVRRVREL